MLSLAPPASQPHCRQLTTPTVHSPLCQSSNIPPVQSPGLYRSLDTNITTDNFHYYPKACMQHLHLIPPRSGSHSDQPLHTSLLTNNKFCCSFLQIDLAFLTLLEEYEIRRLGVYGDLLSYLIDLHNHSLFTQHPDKNTLITYIFRLGSAE